jgi:DNA-binding SARP family transcriptional activator
MPPQRMVAGIAGPLLDTVEAVTVLGVQKGAHMAPRRRCDLRVALLGGFRLCDGGERLELSLGSQRLVAYLALRGSPVRRTMAAGVLWPESSDGRAHASLRSALARALQPGRGTIQSGPLDLSLASGVSVDLEAARDLAHALLNPSTTPVEPHAARTTVATLSAELLPGWYDDWILLEAENWRQLRLHALEAFAISLAAMGSFADAAGAALAAIAADPLRESSHATLIRVHLAEGNRSEACRAFAHCRKLLAAELNLEPTPRLADLVAGLPA